jgi:type VII secretion protein EccB
MWSRREQHQAYRFLTRRIVSAVLSGEPETNELPMRRFATALASGVAVAVLVVAGFAIFGLLFPGGGRPAENVIILERETGAIFIYQGGELHPVLNWTSARLILGQVEVKTMSRTSLRDVPRGPAVGIPDAPATLPDKGSLVGLPWSVCSAPRSFDSVDLATHLLAGWVPDAGQSLGAADALIVSLGTDEWFLVWEGHRLRIAGNLALTALGIAGTTPLPVTPAFLNSLPPGPDLAPLALPDAGQPTGHVVDGAPASVGELFQEPNSGLYYVMTADGLVKVGEVTARLWGAPASLTAQLTPEQASLLLDPDGSVEPAGLPDEVPAVRGERDTAAACTVYQGETDPARAIGVQAYARVPGSLAPLPAGGTGGAVADHVAVPGGRAALVTALRPPGTDAQGTRYLVTDLGQKYALGGADPSADGEAPDAVQKALGYEGVEAVSVPELFLELIPSGSALSPSAALRPAGVTVQPNPTSADPAT